MPGDARRFDFSKSRRLLTPADFRFVFSAADVKAGTAEIFLLARRNEAQSTARLGFVISRKKVRRAVDRNRIKRIAREEFRHLSASGYPNIDIVFMARPGADRLPKADLHHAVRRMLRKLQKRHGDQLDRSVRLQQP